MLTTKIPHSHDAEEATLGCCLIDGNSEVFNQISPKLELDDFYVEKNRTIWQAMGALVEKGSVIDMVTICDQINDEHIFTDIMRICNRVETSVSVNHYVNIVLQKSKLRKIRRGCMTGIDLLDTSEEPEVIINKINDLATDNRSNKDESHITHTLYEIRDEVQRMASGEYEKEYIKTHLPHLDEKIKLEFGSVMTIAAPTSVGKSALSLNIALRACSKDNFPVLIYSLEMPQK
jgi:replicative DNA helicase